MSIRSKFVIVLVFLFCSKFGLAQEEASSSVPTRLMYPVGTLWNLFKDNDVLKKQDWWGLRGKMEENGVEFGIVYTADTVGTVKGGIKNGVTYLSVLDVSMTVDTQKLGWWENGTFFIDMQHSHATRLPTEKYIGDLQTADNIEGPRLTRLLELWYEHKCADGRISTLFGIHDANSEFFVTDVGGLFINSSFGLQPDVSSNATVSTYPLATAGLRLKYTPNENFDFLAGLFNGDPGDHDTNPYGNRIIIDREHGLMTIVEGQWHHKKTCPITKKEMWGTLKIGAWHHNVDKEDYSERDDNGDLFFHDDNFGFYSIMDQMIYKEGDEGEQGLSFFVQYGQAPSDRNLIDMYYGFGLNYTGLIPGRNTDQVGMSLAHASSSSDARLESNTYEAYEQVIEATYRANITDSIVLQPDLQFIQNPGLTDTLENAVVAMLRAELSF